MNRIARWLVRRPLSLAVAGVLALAWLISTLPGTREVLDAGSAGIDPRALGERHWWSWGTSMIAAASAVQFIIAILVALVGLGWVERLLGWRRALVALLVTGLSASAIGIGMEALGLAAHEYWASSVTHRLTLDPLTPLCGAITWASTLAAPPWGRRVRVLLIGVSTALLLYSGQPADLYLLIACLIGVAGGRLTGAGPERTSPSLHERRTLLALTTVLLAVGPLLTLLSSTRYGILSPLGVAIGDVGPVTPGRAAVDCVAGHLVAGCVGALTATRLHGVGSALVGGLPLVLMLIAAYGISIGRRAALWALVVFLAIESAVAAWYLGVLPLGGAARTPAPVEPARYWELTLWVVVSALVPLGFAVVLWINRRAFAVRPPRGRLIAFGAALVAAVAVPATLFVAIAAGDPRAFRPHPTLWRVLSDLPDRALPLSFLRHETPELHPADALGHLAWNLAGPLFWVGVIVAALLLFGPGGRATLLRDDSETARELLLAGGGSLGHMATWPGNQLWIDDAGTSGIAYRVAGGHAVTLSDPFGALRDPEAVIDGFLRFCDGAALVPVFYSVHEDWRVRLARRGWRSLPVAEEAVIDPAAFTVAGKRMQDVRTSMNRAARDGLVAVHGPWSDLPLRITTQIDALSERWAAQKELPELGFTLGGLDELRDRDVLVDVALDANQHVLGVISWLPVRTDGRPTGWTLDFMRRGPDAPNGVMEFLIASAITRFRDDGITAVSLSGSPLASSAAEASPVIGWVLATVGRVLEPHYGFRSLLRFKRKFDPVEQTMHLCFADPAALPGIGFAIAACYLPGLTLRRLRALMPSRVAAAA